MWPSAYLTDTFCKWKAVITLRTLHGWAHHERGQPMLFRKASFITAFMIFFIACFFLWYAGGRPSEGPEAASAGLDEAVPRVLIASQKSEFKNAVVKHLEASLEERPVFYETVGISALGNVDEGEWDAIVIVQCVKMGTINGHVKSYLDRSQDLSKVVLITTCQAGDPKTDAWDVDSITSASKMDEVEPVIEGALSQLDVILGAGTSI